MAKEPNLRVTGNFAVSREDPSFPDFLIDGEGVVVVASRTATPKGRVTRAAVPTSLGIDVTPEPGAAYIVVARQPSGAITFHLPVARATRSAATATRTAPVLHFDVAVRPPPAPVAGMRGSTRGLVSKAVKWVLLKIVGSLASRALPLLARGWETARWSLAKRPTGLVRVTPEALANGGFARVAPGSMAGGRSLVYIHGTFSHTAGAFGGLAKAGIDFLEFAREYSNRIAALEHFTVSVSPEENARELIEQLTLAGATDCDVITHSRGGLVALEWARLAADAGGTPRPSRAVLVASPTQGTALADGAKWDRMLGIVANLLEVVPANPLTEAASFVTEGLRWLAQKATGELPGLAAMDPEGDAIARLRSTAYRLEAHALVSDYQAPPALLQRAGDLAIDAFFGSANDLVVPTDGGTFLGASAIAPSRIGRFGANGNLQSVEGRVTHCTFFDEVATSQFLTRSFRDAAVQITRSTSRSGDSSALAPASTTVIDAARGPVSIAATATAPGSAAIAIEQLVVGTSVEYPALQLTFLPAITASNREADRRYATLLASYGSARSFIPLDLNRSSLRKIRATHTKIRAFLDGEPDAEAPDDPVLIEYGTRLFKTLFAGSVGRLYDVARSRQGDDLLEIVVTSAHPELSDLPWEFAYDPVRKTWIATEDVIFVRNVVTPVPADDLGTHAAPVSILVVSAQPLGAASLSIAQETDVLKAGFAGLERSGLAKVTVLPRATPAALHAAAQSGKFDVVHFIGHGTYDEEKDTGYLLFQDASGASQSVGVRTMREILSHRRIRLVFLNACETGRGGPVDFNRGVAPGLVAAGIPAVVANQYKVFDPSAVAFAEHFYWSLAHGVTVGAAAREARIAVNYLIHGEAIDWAVPVVYARDARRMRLVTPTQGYDATESTLAFGTRTRTRRGDDKAIRVGIWDVRWTIRGLDSILTHLNSVQSVYHFEEVSRILLPLGTWRRRRVRGAVQEYLNAEYVARRLRGVPQSLGVDYLFCLTDQPLMSDTTLNLLAWWDDEVGSRIRTAVLSSADLDLGADNELLPRALANSLVTVLASFVTGEDAHKHPPRNCPLYYNEERDASLVAGPLQFDAKCAGAIRRKKGGYLKALNELLRAYQR